MVERHNRTISNYLSMFVSENQRDWDKLVPLFLLAYKSSQHDVTGYTPSMLLTGRELKLTIDVLCGSPSDDSGTYFRLSSDRMKTRFDKNSQTVWLYQPQRRKGLCPKLQRLWQGSYLVIKKINDLVYRIQSSPRSKPKVVHIEG
ncbi:uncharacterized protein [Leptinotarsa decemlineata]|uniref:uncharacterized protein n=1 Tax=Leptinotarsa decemlineata TaxID=7539 RepID=UPI003D30C6F5